MGLQGYEKALAQQDHVSLGDRQIQATRIQVGHDGVVRFDNWTGSWSGSNQYIDLSEQNTVTEALEQIRQQSMKDISQDPKLQSLLTKNEWSYEDRVNWERGISQIVSSNHNSVSGLDTYRIASKDPNVTRINDMGRLSQDIDGTGSPTIEHDCETMSSFEGIILTQLEQSLLPQESTGADDYKQTGSYYSASGGVKYSIKQDAGGHRFLISGTTGNIIEGTADPDYGQRPYVDTGREYGFNDFVAGEVARSKSIVERIPGDEGSLKFRIAIYGPKHSAGDADVVARRHELIGKQDFAGLADVRFTRDEVGTREDLYTSAFFQSGKETFTVTKPQATDGIEGLYIEHQKSTTVDEVLTSTEAKSMNSYGDAFFDTIHETLIDHNFAEKGRPVVIGTEDGRSLLIHPNSGGVFGNKLEIFDVTGKAVTDAPTVYIKSEDVTVPAPVVEPIPAPVVEPTPDPVPASELKVCTQLHNKRPFTELLDGKGILNDNGKGAYNDADAIQDLVQAAKGLGLSENVYGHIEEAMADGKFVGTAASIKAIKASHAALEYSKTEGLNDVQIERSVVKTFFENITVDDLITDTKAADDIIPFDENERNEARSMAKEIDETLNREKECTFMNNHWKKAIESTTQYKQKLEADPVQKPNTLTLEQ